MVQLGEETKRLQAREAGHNQTKAQVNELAQRNDELSSTNSQLRDKLSTALGMLTISGQTPSGSREDDFDVAAFVESCQALGLPAFSPNREQQANENEPLPGIQNQVCSKRWSLSGTLC